MGLANSWKAIPRKSPMVFRPPATEQWRDVLGSRVRSRTRDAMESAIRVLSAGVRTSSRGRSQGPFGTRMQEGSKWMFPGGIPNSRQNRGNQPLAGCRSCSCTRAEPARVVTTRTSRTSTGGRLKIKRQYRVSVMTCGVRPATERRTVGREGWAASARPRRFRVFGEAVPLEEGLCFTILPYRSRLPSLPKSGAHIMRDLLNLDQSWRSARNRPSTESASFPCQTQAPILVRESASIC